MNNTSWASDGNKFYQVKTNSLVNTLPFGVYKLCFNPQEGFSLEKIEDAFLLPKKLYGMERAFIEHFKRTYFATDGNLGVLLDGLKGTGKSVTAKILANELQLPILLLETNFGAGMVDYVSGIQQDITVFADEYEKIFKGQKEDEYNSREEDSTLLTLMDGVRKTEHRKVFLLTSNEVRIHDAMKQRPGRLRYIKNFGNLGREVIEEIVDDMLAHKELRDVTIRFIAKLEQITVDIVTALVTEVNIHRADPQTFADVFNVKEIRPLHNVILMTDKEEITVAFGQERLGGWQDPEDSLWEGNNFAFKGVHMGTISDIAEDGSFTAEMEDVYLTRVKQQLPHVHKHFKKKNRFRLESIQGWHSSYSGAF
jgi:SpoVK/Ycf46/Vps4 family AAA+-type ATPase